MKHAYEARRKRTRINISALFKFDINYELQMCAQSDADLQFYIRTFAWDIDNRSVFLVALLIFPYNILFAPQT